MTNTSDRAAQLRSWTCAQLQARFFLPESESVKWFSVAGDASARQYHRVVANTKSYIVMDAPPDAENIDLFIEVAAQMREASLRVPDIFASDSERGFMLLEDFGDTLVKALLQRENGQQLFNRIMPLLEGMSHCPRAELAVYSSEKLYDELQLFADWYLAAHKQQPISAEHTAEQWWQWQQLCERLIEAAQSQPKIFVHRDFHSCNLQLLNDDSLGIIDFQDAFYGPISYDLVSWLWDRYVEWPRADIEKWMLQAREKLAPQIDAKSWIRLCDLMGLQRNLKIVGIFSRLHYRDNRSGYIEMIPRFSAYLKDVLPRYSELADCGSVVLRYLELE
jgi:hypothetical protein